MKPYHEILCILQSSRLESYIEACIDLGVFDHLSAGPLSVETLASRTATHRRALHRCLRGLAHSGLFTWLDEQVVALTDVSRPLVADAEISLRPWHKLHRMHKPEASESIEHVKQVLRTGQSLYQIKHGCLYYEYLTNRQEIAAIFDDAMASVSHGEIRDILEGFDFSATEHLTEIAGGIGALIAGVLRKHTAMRGLLLDRPDVIERSLSMPRLTAMGVDMHVSLPEIPGDAMMKRILHSYSDDKARNILSNIGCRMAPGKTLTMFDLIDDHHQRNPYIGAKHLQMLSIHGAPGDSGGPGERTVSEFESVLATAGFKLIKTENLGAIDAIVAIKT